MRVFRIHARRRRARLLLLAGFLAAVSAAPPASSQSSSGDRFVPFWQQPQPQAPPAGAPATAKPPGNAAPPRPNAPAPTVASVIARVEGRPITQEDFDRIAGPYLRKLRADFGGTLDDNVQSLANFNVLDELVRRELVAIETQRRKIVATQADIDSVLMTDPFFLTNGKFDGAKFNAYKSSPESNYLQVLPRLRELAATSKFDVLLRRRCTPSDAQVRVEWARRNDQARFRVLPLLTRDMPIDGESVEADWEPYYRAHPDQFMRRTRVRLRYARLPLLAAGDTARAASERDARARARQIADSLRAGTLADTSSRFVDTGLFDVPASFVPGLGRAAALTDSLARTDEDSTLRWIGPLETGDAIVVGAIVERQGRHVPPMADVIADVKRRADAEKRRLANDAERRAFYDEHRERWRAPRVRLTRAVLAAGAVAPRAPAPADIDRWYAQHGRTLFGVRDSSRAWLPPINDSLRAVARLRMTEEARAEAQLAALEPVAAALRGTGDVRAAARARGAAVETLSVSRFSAPDSLFDRGLLDSLLASAPSARGAVRGPRAIGPRVAAWRIDGVDTGWVAPYESVRGQSDQEFTEDRRRKDDADAKVYFDQHRGEFRSPPEYGLDYVAVAIPPADSVRVPEADLRREYDGNLARFHREEEVKARHILFMTRGAGPEVEKAAKARADSLLAAIRKDGGDFTALAKRFSQEPGAATGGGDLGWFGRGRMVKEFEDAAFALKPGEISGVVKTQFGYHLIKVEDRHGAGTRPFEEARAEIRTRLAQARGDSTARRAAEGLRRRLALGGNAKLLAAPHGGVVSPAPIQPNETIGGLGFVPGLAQDLPAMPLARWAPKVYRAGTSYIVLRVRERLAERPAEFGEAKSQAVDAVKNARRRTLLEQKTAAIRAALAAGASLDSLAAPLGGLKDSGLLAQGAAYVPGVGSDPRVVQKAFAMKPGERSDTLQVATGVVWLRLEERKTGDPATYKAAAAQIEAELTKQRYDEWLEQEKKTVRIEILRPDLKHRPLPARATMTSSGG
jgi:parvulin-like peptidyl-prolyl isomerase